MIDSDMAPPNAAVLRPTLALTAERVVTHPVWARIRTMLVEKTREALAHRPPDVTSKTASISTSTSIESRLAMLDQEAALERSTAFANAAYDAVRDAVAERSVKLGVDIPYSTIADIVVAMRDEMSGFGRLLMMYSLDTETDHVHGLSVLATKFLDQKVTKAA